MHYMPQVFRMLYGFRGI